MIDALFIFPALAKRFMSTIAPTLKRMTGLDHLYQFLWKHLIRNGAIRDKVVRTARWALRHRRSSDSCCARSCSRWTRSTIWSDW